MAHGLLEVRGTIAVEQFWPKGDSDADTTKVKVRVDHGAFRFREHPGAPLRETHAFDDARVIGRASKDIIDSKGRIVIRLQGIDAAELHYMPQAAKPKDQQTKKERERFLEWNFQYRQPYAESATVALKTLLAHAGATVPCRVLTAVEQPDDAIDTYGRLVGDIHVTLDGTDVNINRWSMSSGWTLPSFYNSMSNEEIQALLELAATARQKGLGLWPHLATAVGAFDFDLRYRKTAPEGATDAGDVLMPKLFRRLATWAVNKRAKMVSDSFKTYLHKKNDLYYRIDDFLAQGPTAATPRVLDDIIGAKGVLHARAEDLVFHEAAARLLGPDGKTPTWW
jgi:endonuclease YncB( thermonuclease family)